MSCLENGALSLGHCSPVLPRPTDRLLGMVTAAPASVDLSRTSGLPGCLSLRGVLSFSEGHKKCTGVVEPVHRHVVMAGEVLSSLKDHFRQVVEASGRHGRSFRPCRLCGGAARSSHVRRAARGTTRRRPRRSEGNWPARARSYASPREMPSSCAASVTLTTRRSSLMPPTSFRLVRCLQVLFGWPGAQS